MEKPAKPGVPADYRLTEPSVHLRLEQAIQRIHELETALRHNQETVGEMQRRLLTLNVSYTWRLAQWLQQSCSCLLPARSRRRAIASRVFRSFLQLRQRLPTTFRGRFLRSEINRRYFAWIAAHEPSLAELAEQRARRHAYEPVISVIVAVHNPQIKLVKKMLRSVIGQTYGKWELCIANAGGAGSPASLLLCRYAEADPRIKVQLVDCRHGTVDRCNAALALATGEYLSLLGPEGILAPFAFSEIVKALNNSPDIDFLYADEDRIKRAGDRRFDPVFKPDWSPDYMRSGNYLGVPVIVSRSLLRAVGPLRSEFLGAASYDWALRATEKARRIVHIPKILYHRWTNSNPDAGAGDAADFARKALEEHLSRLGTTGAVRKSIGPGTYQINYSHPHCPLISVIIPNRDEVAALRRAVDSIARSSYHNHEIIIAENGSRLPETHAYYRDLESRSNTRILRWNQPFNYAAVNNFAVAHARGEILLFLNNDVEAINTDWMERMLEHALRSQVGAVGAKLYFPDGSIQHAGVYVGNNVVGQPYRFCRGDSTGYLNRLLSIHNCSAVIAACMMMRKNLFEELHGFDEDFVLALNDIDLCMRIRQKGRLIVWTPFAQLYHWESKTRGYDDRGDKQSRFLDEARLFAAKWGRALQQDDPYYRGCLTPGRWERTFTL
jgi:GT2 family glycosyltransferase